MALQITPSSADSDSLEQQVRKRIESLSYLPTTVAVAMKFVELGKNPEAEPSEYATVISSDPSLSTKLLALANSSWFGVRNKVTKPQMAVNLLGLGTVRTLAISFCLTGLHSELRLTPEESRMLWAASLCKAVAAKQYAAHFEPKCADEAFTAALFQDFAMPVMLAVAKQDFLNALQDTSANFKTHLERQRNLFHLDHAEIGRIVAQKLELPEIFVDAVAFHHNHENLQQFIENPVLANAIYAASLFPHLLVAWNPDDVSEFQRLIATETAQKPLDCSTYLADVQKEYDQLYAYFEPEQSTKIKLTELLEIAIREAADCTTRLVGTVQTLLQEAANAGKQIHQILSDQNRLEQAAFHDSLTSALNRDGFTRAATDILTTATRYSTGFSLAFLDIDRFKTLNDTYGHAAGDAALKHLVATAKKILRPNDCIGRLGGDEFAILMPECSQDEAQRLLQNIVSTIAQSTIPAPSDQKAAFTVSAGLFSLPPRAAAAPFDKLMAAADQLMYQAKNAGGNRLSHALLPSAKAA